MPMFALLAYVEMLEPLRAQQQLRQIEAVSVPHMKQDSVGQLMRRLVRRAKRERPKSVAEQLMGAMKVNVVPVPKPKKEGSDGG